MDEEIKTTIEEAEVPAIEEPKEQAGPRKARVPIALIAVIVVIAAAAGVLSLTHNIVWFRHGVHFKNASSISHKLEEGETAKLAYLPDLSSADFGNSSNYAEIYEWAQAHPEVDVSYTVALPSGASYDAGTHIADLTALDHDAVEVTANQDVRYILGIEGVKLDLSDWSYKQMETFASTHPEWRIEGSKDLGRVSVNEFAAYRKVLPDADFNGEVLIGETPVSVKAESIVLPGADVVSIEALRTAAPYMSNLKTVDFGSEEGHERLADVYAFLKDHPGLDVEYTFGIFDRTPGIHDVKLDLNHRKMTDQGEEVRQVIACMPDLKWLDMDSCGVDDEHMAAIRDDYPDVKVVWRIWFGPRKTYSVRTNAIKILASAPESAGSLTPASAASLKYCTDMKYLDIGHNEYLYNIDFVNYMPNLEVFIVMDGTISDISALANCPHLEFVELFTNRITDLSPLSGLKELRHLNINWNTRLADITPLYGLDLERLWIGRMNKVPKEQIEEFRALHPNCQVNDTCIDSHDGWRWDEDRNYYPRYALLREQMGYHYPEGPTDYSYYWRDPLYEPHDDSVQDSLCPY